MFLTVIYSSDLSVSVMSLRPEPNMLPKIRKMMPERTALISMMISMARAKFVLFTFRQPPHAHTRSRIRLTMGSIISNMMPINPPVVIGSYLLPGGRAFGSGAGAYGCAA